MAIVMKNIVKKFGVEQKPILKGISGTIETGEMLSIIGRSGSGKSTLLYIISSLDQPSDGDVEIDGRSIKSMSRKELHHFRNAQMGFVFQFHHLLPELTALENILMPARKLNQHQSKKDYALDLMREFDIESKGKSFPSELSGGEQQRVAIARALIMKPRYVFADEPTGNLDSQNGQAVLDLFQKINQEMKTTIIYVTHDLEFANLAKRKIQMVDGQVV